MHKSQKKIAAYSTAAVSFLFINNVDAQLVTDNYDPDLMIIGDYDLDFNLDGATDVHIDFWFDSFFYATSSSFTSSQEKRWELQDVYGMLAGSPTFLADAPVNYGYSIQSLLPWTPENKILFEKQVWENALFFESNILNEEWYGSNKIMPVKFLIEGLPHYGWVRLAIAKNRYFHKLPTLYIQEIAYNAEPDTPLIVEVNHASVAGSVQLQDLAETNSPSDLVVSFPHAMDEATVSAYRIFIYPSADPTPTVSILNTLEATRYIEVMPSGMDISVSLSDDLLDINGNPLLPETLYRAIVLSIADGDITDVNDVSIPSPDAEYKYRYASYPHGDTFYDSRDENSITDFTVTFNKSKDETTISEYRVYISNYNFYGSLASVILLDDMYYTAVIPDGSIHYSIIPDASKLVYDDGAPLLFHRYYTYLAAMPNGTTASIPSVTGWFNNIVFCYEPYPVIPLVTVNSGSTQTNSIRVTVPMFYDETVLEQYRFYLVKATDVFTATDTYTVTSGWSYTNKYPTGNDLDIYLDNNMKDWQGDDIDPDQPYKLVVGYIGNARTISLPSVEFTLSSGITSIENENIKPVIANIDNTLFIQFEKAEHFIIEMFSVDGKRIFSETISDTKFEKSFADLTTGIYQVLVKTEKAIFSSSILIIQE